MKPFGKRARLRRKLSNKTTAPVRRILGGRTARPALLFFYPCGAVKEGEPLGEQMMSEIRGLGMKNAG